MVQGMAFLSKKGFNPTNNVNRKQVYEAQQHNKLEQERIRKRAVELRREQEDEELCAARHNGDGSVAQLRFMYDAPPGLKAAEDMMNNNNEEEEEGRKKTKEQTKKTDVTQVQPGDDAAAVAFRRMLSAASAQNQQNQQNQQQPSQEEEQERQLGDDEGEPNKLGFAPVLQGSSLEHDQLPDSSTDTRSALEKAVGRKDRNAALTLEEQVARFPQLKNAPMAKGMSITDVNVSFKPLGAQLRNVKCLACGVWGHSRGDRECGKTGWDPFSAARPSTAAAAVATTTTMTMTTIRPTTQEQAAKIKIRKEKRKHENDDASTASSSSSSSSSSEDSRRRRKRKHKSSKHSKRRHHKESSKHSKRRRSESPSRRRNKHSKKSKKPSRKDDDR
jgi:CBF1 interacting corepressor